MGRLSRDVELRYSQSGSAIANIGLAVNRKWKDASGSLQSENSFFDCVAFGKTAETMAQYLSKGKPVHISGRLKQDVWSDATGQNRSKVKVIVESFQFVEPAKAGAQAAPSQPRPGQPPPQQQWPSQPDQDVLPQEDASDVPF